MFLKFLIISANNRKWHQKTNPPISHRHAKAKNEYMGAEFDPTKDCKFISYLDANNLYGWAMSKNLATSGCKKMTDDELDDWKHLSCFLEVDLEYP